MTVGKMAEVTLKFVNPLKTSLTNCFFVVDGPGLTRPKQISMRWEMGTWKI